jgi:prolyl-tRNA synthetase
MAHGYDSGLIFPPRVAPTQIVIVPIPARANRPAEDEAVRGAVEAARQALVGAGYRVDVDWSDKTPGWKFNEWELRGVPLRVEIGPRDVQRSQAVLVRRDTREKAFVPLAGLPTVAGEVLERVQAALYQRAVEFQRARTRHAASLDELKARLQATPGFVLAHWCGSAECEARVKAETGATIRCVPFEEPEMADGAVAQPGPGACVVDGRPSEKRALFARAY